jgi:hypothetical protein
VGGVEADREVARGLKQIALRPEDAAHGFVAVSQRAQDSRLAVEKSSQIAVKTCERVLQDASKTRYNPSFADFPAIHPVRDPRLAVNVPLPRPAG